MGNDRDVFTGVFRDAQTSFCDASSRGRWPHLNGWTNPRTWNDEIRADAGTVQGDGIAWSKKHNEELGIFTT